MRKQTAVYWPPGSEETGGADYDGYGHPLFASPVEISCRWEDIVQEFVDSENETRFSQSIVYTDRDVKLRGVLMLGTLNDVTDLDNPKENEGAWEIRRFDKLPNLRNTEILRTAYL
jgi:hypothetical protein